LLHLTLNVFNSSILEAPSSGLRRKLRGRMVDDWRTVIAGYGWALQAKEAAERWWQERHAEAEERATRWLQQCTTLEVQVQESGELEVNRLAQLAALEQSVESRGRTIEQLKEQLRYWEKQSTASEALQEQV
jgi:hypothetical protein